MRVIISAGGTGGHIYPAIAVADEIKARVPDADILFIGASDRMEMERVPKAGYPIKGLWISGLQRKLTLRNLLFPLKVVKSLSDAYRIIKTFKPDVVLGFGGFASGPTLYAANLMGLPTLIQEQNSYPGITNKLLAKKVDKVCVAYDEMNRWFAPEKLTLTGNPVREGIGTATLNPQEAIGSFGLSQNKKTVLIFGGSLGAKSLNEAVFAGLETIKQRTDINIIWQVGKLYFDQYASSEAADLRHVTILPFIEEMDAAYAAADVIVGRAGALTLSELAIVGKPAILVPSPNVSEDHQTKNAMAIVKVGGAILVKDNEANANLIPTIYQLIDDDQKQVQLGNAIKALGKPNATKQITDLVMDLVQISQASELPNLSVQSTHHG